MHSPVRFIYNVFSPSHLRPTQCTDQGATVMCACRDLAKAQHTADAINKYVGISRFPYCLHCIDLPTRSSY